MNRLMLVAIMALLAALIVAPLTMQADRPTRVNFGDVLTFVRDSGCSADPSTGMITSATPPETLIYDADACAPVLAPDGQHVSLGEWKAAEGTATVKCIGQGTHTTVHFSGLIPGGTYTVWLFIFANGGPPTPFTAAGALGNSDPGEPIQNYFTASAAGEGQLSLTNTSGVLSAVPGAIGSCWLDAYPEVHLALVYHIDRNTYGPVPGPMNTWAVQEVYMFK